MNAGVEPMAEESAKAYRAFCVYRDLGPDRSLDKVAETLYPTKEGQKGRKRAATGRLQEWSSRFRWVERARGHDLDKARIEREAWSLEQWEIARKRAEVSRRMLDLVLSRLLSLRPEDVPINSLPRWVDAAAKVSVVIDGPDAGAQGSVLAQERVDSIIRDPELRRLALEMDERMEELDRSQASAG